MEYTKGEWKYNRKHAPATHGIKVSDDLFSSITSNDTVICFLPEPHYMPDMGDRVYYNDSVEAMKANAYLIAAAPDTYKGLKDALQEICRLCVRLNPQHEDCKSCEDMEERRKALAKAEGK